jgi:hypothetical protein
MRFSATLLLFCALWIASGSLAHAQRFTTKGTDFWLAFMDAVKFGRDTIQLNVYISSDVATSGTISMPLAGWSLPFTVAAGSVTTIAVPTTTALVKGTESIQQQGIHVVANDSVSVFALNYVPGSADANIVLPTASLGNIYRVLAYSPYIDGDPADPSAPHYPCEFLVIGTGDPLEIEITPAGATLGGRPAGVPFSITLAAGEVYQVQSDSDLTGSLVRAIGQGSDCKNFALLAGAQFTVVGFVAGTRCRYADHLVEQMYPLNAWGNEYFTVPLVLYPGTGEARGDQIRMLAAYNGTTVTIDGGAPFTLNAGEYREEFIDRPVRITSTQPIAVAQYSRGQRCYQINGTDPFMVMLSPARQQLRRITFEAFIKAEILSYYLNIVTHT